jgi:hypothetical protein
MDEMRRREREEGEEDEGCMILYLDLNDQIDTR